MEIFKRLSEVAEIDRKHLLLGRINGAVIQLDMLHARLDEIELHSGVPEEVRGQFNVAKNMALYTYFCYSLAPEVQLKTYTIIEYALRLKANSDRKLMLRKLLKMAVREQWISDAGFRHIKNPSRENHYCKSLIEVLPSLRNSSAHGSNMLVPDCIGHIEKCADFVNQLFSRVM
jgi:hypothetical protein